MDYYDVDDLRFGVIDGNKTVLLIKVGSDGDINGYQDKYIEIAKEANRLYQVTVIICSNPHKLDSESNMEKTLAFVKKHMKEAYQILYMGHSYGAFLGGCYGYKYKEIKKMLLINGPLMYNLHKFKAGIRSFNGDMIELVYGKLDQSFTYTELLTPLLNEKVKLTIIENQDHNFSSDINEFMKLPNKYLFEVKE